jgi:uncharacterized protein YqfA (UPF0365 family)
LIENYNNKTFTLMPFFVIPVVLVASIKAFFVIHGLSISVAAMEAGYRAYRNGDDVVDAAVSAGATRAAAVLLSDAFKKFG